MNDQIRERTEALRDGNPEPGLAAIASDGGLTVAQFAVLVRAQAPIMVGDVSDPAETIKAIYLLSLPIREGYAAASDGDLLGLALEWADGIGTAEYGKRLNAALDSILEFWKLMPRPEGDSQKKNRGGTGTEISPNSLNGPAERTGGRSGTHRGRFLRYISRFFSVAIRKESAD